MRQWIIFLRFLSAVCALLICVGAKNSSTTNSSTFVGLSISPRIIGGQNARRGQFPWQVSIRRVHNNRHACGGAIIGDAWVLTAAHCFRKYSHPENNSIIVGAYQFKNDGYLHEIAEIIIHPQVELLSRNAHDIAILRSKINFKLNEYHVYPIALPKRASKPGEVAIISGWGLTKYPMEHDDLQYPNLLQYENTVLISRQQCIDMMWDQALVRAIHDYVLCSLDMAGHGMCHGDSGGPLINKDLEIIGIVSWGRSCALGFPDMFVSVYHHRDWILQIMDMNNKINQIYFDDNLEDN